MMTASVLDSTKGWEGEGSREGKAVVTLERYRRKRLPLFDDKSSAEAYTKLIFDIGLLVQEKCSIEFNSWEMVHVDLNNSMVQELSVVWDVDETDEKQRKYVDDLFKK
ncbi:hypothetical protein DVH24_008068 [Malus domestica]|uniref:Uncharacterized protein n=1 Tax=Malus domestica TaxID=3750 RepID=A0A498JIK7_MALDO|nr:hypothetical protein DVH24_008068 [Malus domestica]